MKKNRRVIAFLLLIAFTVSGSTFAYWVSNVEGTETTTEEVLTIGYGEDVITELTISTNEESADMFLVPMNQVNNSIGKATGEIILNHRLVWEEVQDISQVDGETIIGSISEEVYIEIYPEGSTEALNRRDFEDIYNLIQITPNSSNLDTITLNNTSPVSQSYQITMDEPKNKTDYEIIRRSTIKYTFLYEIDTDIYDIDYDFTEMTIEDILERDALVKYDFRWDSQMNDPLNITRGNDVFFPVKDEEFTLTVVAKLDEGYNGGYGIYFDSIITDQDALNDAGNVFQFDRGYGAGAMIVRPREFGNEGRPTFIVDNDDTSLVPHKYDDNSWWTELHEIIIKTEAVDQYTMEASFYIDGDFIGSYQYTRTISEDRYVGFRVWGPDTQFYSLKVQ